MNRIEEDMDGCSSTNTTPTYVSVSFLIVTFVTGLAVSVAGSYVAYKKTKGKLWQQMMLHTHHEEKQQNKKIEIVTAEFELERNLRKTVERELRLASSATTTTVKPETTVTTNIEVADKHDDINISEASDDINSFLSTFLCYLPKEIWNKRRCYFPFATHLIDQATDIGVIIKFYQISQYENSDNDIDCPNINGTNLFYLSLSAFIFYRIVSCIWIYSVTNGKIIDTILQIFDLKLYHALYINFVLHKQEPNNPQRYLQVHIQCLSCCFYFIFDRTSNVHVCFLCLLLNTYSYWKQHWNRFHNV